MKRHSAMVRSAPGALGIALAATLLLITGCAQKSAREPARSDTPLMPRPQADSAAMPRDAGAVPQSAAPNASPPTTFGDKAVRGDEAHNTESYAHIIENPFLTVANAPLSTSTPPLIPSSADSSAKAGCRPPAPCGSRNC